jgi:hypothetical protein
MCRSFVRIKRQPQRETDNRLGVALIAAPPCLTYAVKQGAAARCETESPQTRKAQ